MIQIGANITAVGDPLQKAKVEYLYHKLTKPNETIAAQIRQLRIIRQLDSKQYNTLMRKLPYFVCGIFNPPYRRTENFGYIEYFVVDIDHLEDKELTLSGIKERVVADSRVLMCFESHSQDGVVIIFRLQERCYDAAVFSIFYKLFVHSFSQQYSFEQVVDANTSDVTSACFVSIDPDAYYNPDAEPISLQSFVDIENTRELFRLKKELAAQAKSQGMSSQAEDAASHAPSDEVLAHIKKLLKPGIKLRPKKDPYIPDRLNAVMAGLECYIAKTGVLITAVVNIQYGKKIKMQNGLKLAEINLFYGKNGFSVVQSPRRGTNDELNDLTAKLIEQYLATDGNCL